jgi:hypothetical protein
MEPARLSPDRRFYGCRTLHCPCPLVPAELLETLVWQAFLYLFAKPEARITGREWRQALEHALALREAARVTAIQEYLHAGSSVAAAWPALSTLHR